MYNTTNAQRFIAPIPLGNGAFVAISEQKRAGRGVGLAFIADGTDVALMGIPSADPDAVVAAIAGVIPGGILKRIVVLEWDDRLIDVLHVYARFAPHAVIVADRRVAAAIFADIPQKVVSIIDANDTVAMPNGRVIGFLPSPFVFSPSALMVYDHRSHVLFTNRLFEIMWDKPLPSSLEETIPAMREYHRMYAPSSEYLRPVLADVARLDPDAVVTRTGSVYGRETVKRLIAELSAVEFFNSPRAVGQPSDVRSFSHAALATQILFKFASAYGEDAVLSTFVGSTFTIRPKTYEIEAGIPDDYRVWQRLFDLVYAKRGTPWLALAEPLVDKLVSLYGVVKPSVYQSKLAEAEKQAALVDAAKKDLEARVEQLEANLSATLDKLTRDSTTGVYNELFFRTFLIGATASPDDHRADDLVLLHVAIDELARIIARYSKATADEMIRKFGYLLDRTRRPQDFIVKRNGRGYVVCLTDGGVEAAQETLRKIREGVRDADAFIEPLTVSAALVRLAEFPRDLRGEKLADAVFIAGEQRLRSALETGLSAYVDEFAKIETVRAGRILLVDDDPSALALLADLLRSDNYDVTTATDGLSALAAGRAKAFDVVVCERNVPKLDGFALRQELYAAGSAAPRMFILTTYVKTRDTVVRANQSEIDFVLEKPVIYEELAGLVRRLARRERTQR